MSLDEERQVLAGVERLVVAALQGIRHLGVLYADELNTPPPIDAEDDEHEVDQRWWGLGSMLGRFDGLVEAWAGRAGVDLDERVRLSMMDVEDVLALDDEARELLESVDRLKMDADGLRRVLRAFAAGMVSAAEYRDAAAVEAD